MLDYLLFSYGGEIAILAVTVVFGGLGYAAKQIYKKFVTDKQKEAAAKTAAACVEQVWKTIHGPEKLKKALEYAAQMLLGSAQLILESGKHPGELKDAVCSPGGTTIAGVRALEQGGFRASAMAAVEAAYKRTADLRK